MTATGKKVGLALGGGAAKGMAHIGILEVFQKEHIPIDMIAGTSIGAAIGAVFAGTQDASYLKLRVLELGAGKLARLIDPAMPRNGFIKGEKIKDLLASLINRDNIKFNELAIPFACVATDIDTGKEVIFDHGNVIDAVRASISIPGVFTVVHSKGRHLVDGQLVDPVPVNVLRQMGADFVIAVNVIPDMRLRESLAGDEHSETHRELNLLTVMMQSIYIASYRLARASLELADFVIEPDVTDIAAGDFQRSEECILRGELAAVDAVHEIKKQLGL